MLRVVNLTKKFGNFVVLNDISFSIEENEILGLVGPNGSGKTTMFNIISGLLSPNSGKIFFGGREITKLPPNDICKLGIARTFQIPRLFENLSVEENIFLGALAKYDIEKAKEKTHEIMRFFGIEKLRETKARYLTSGDRKLVELSRALATQPKLLLIDEIFYGFNPTEVDSVLEFLNEILKMGITICIIEHRLKQIMKILDRVIVLCGGRIIANGKPEEICSNEEVIKHYLGS